MWHIVNRSSICGSSPASPRHSCCAHFRVFFIRHAAIAAQLETGQRKQLRVVSFPNLLGGRLFVVREPVDPNGDVIVGHGQHLKKGIGKLKSGTWMAPDYHYVHDAMKEQPPETANMAGVVEALIDAASLKPTRDVDAYETPGRPEKVRLQAGGLPETPEQLTSSVLAMAELCANSPKYALDIKRPRSALSRTP